MSARVKAVRSRRDLADAIFDMESTVREPLNLLDALVMAIEGAEIDKKESRGADRHSPTRRATRRKGVRMSGWSCIISRTRKPQCRRHRPG